MLPEPVDGIHSRQSLAVFIRMLRDSHHGHGYQWEHRTLGEYLDALAACVEDAPEIYRNFHRRAPTEADWNFFAQMLSAATAYRPE